MPPRMALAVYCGNRFTCSVIIYEHEQFLYAFFNVRSSDAAEVNHEGLA